MSTPGAATDEHGRIAVDLACIQCGYNLRTLREADTCPECGAAVALSSQDRLETADRVWLAGMCRGMKWVLVGAVISGVRLLEGVVSNVVSLIGFGRPLPSFTTLLLFAMLIFIAWRLTRRIKRDAIRHATYVLGAVVVFWLWTQQVWALLDSMGARRALTWLGFVLSLVGLWLVSRPQPRRVTPVWERVARLWARAAIVLVCAIWCWNGLAMRGAGYGYWQLTFALHEASWIVLMWGMMGLARSMAQRGGEVVLVRHCRVVWLGYAATVAITLAIFAMAMIAQWAGWNIAAAGSILKVVMGVEALLRVSELVFMAWAVIIGLRLMRRIRPLLG